MKDIQTRMPKIEGRVIIPANFRYAEFSFLDKRYNSLMNDAQKLNKSDYGNNPALSVIKYNPEKEVFEGSNMPSVVLLNMLLRGNGSHYRTATSQDLEYVILANDPKFNASHLRGNYEDTGIALRDDQSPNDYHAKDLIAQLQKELGLEFKLPYKIDLDNLELRLDPNSPNKLAYNILDPNKAVYAPILNEETGKFEDSDPSLLRTGLPGKLGRGTRTLFAPNSKHGFQRLVLYDGLDVGSVWDYPGGSVSVGRVVVVGEADAQKIKQQIISNYNKRIKQFEADRQKALSFLNGKK